MNNTTTITLNDRFSQIKKPQGNPQQPRGRSRSRSRGPNLQGSVRNRSLLDQLEKQHKMRMALKLKNKGILASRGRVQGQIIRTGARRAANIRKNVNVRQLQRSNTLTSYVPLNDMNLNARGPMRGRSRSRSRGGQSRGRGQQQNGRSRSQSRNRNQQAGGSITDRLGVRQPRRRMRGGAANQGNGGQQQQQRSRSRPQSRVRLNRNNFANGNRNNNNNQVSQMRRSNSVNARLGSSGPRNGNVPKNTNGPALNRRRLASKNRGQIQTPQNNRSQFINRPMRGRIVKQTKLNGVGRARKPMRNGNALGVNPRRGLPAKRGAKANNAQGQARGRAGNKTANKANGQGAGRQGRSRTRRGGKTNVGRGNGGPKITTEQLDKEMDEYMGGNN